MGAKRLVDKEIAKFDDQDKVRVAIEDGNGRTMQFNTRGHQEVEIASQITPPIILSAHRQLGATTTLTNDVAVNATVILVTSTTGAVVGDEIGLTDAVDLTNPRYYVGHILSFVADTSITVSEPLDQAYVVADTSVVYLTHKLNAVGTLAAPVIFSLRTGDVQQINITVDITRVLMSGVTAALVDLSKFGDIAGGVANGLMLRKKFSNGSYQNLVTLNDNFDMAKIAYDFQVYEKSNPAQGVDGFSWRLTFGGEEKVGTVLRVAPDEDLEVWVQDDLSSITTLEFIFEGAQVAD